MTAAPSRPSTVLVLDDEPDLRTLYELTLLREGYRVDTAATLSEARERLANQCFDAVITDMRLPDGLGLDLLREMGTQRRREPVIVITAYGSAENAVDALKAGAFDYLTKPVDLRQFREVVRSAVQSESAESPPRTATAAPGVRPPHRPPARPEAGAPADALARLVGQSAAMQAVKSRIVKVAQSMAPVLVRGESGTGKELVARAIHDSSHRAPGPFVAVNCGAIPESLLETEFFGARKGAYTGSVADRDGYFQAARGGTLFLDEIGDLPLAMQSKLLRAIQERRVRPVGAVQEDAVDVRIVSATHKDLAAEVQAGRFRQDLYYRLNVIDILIPPLRERREDLPALCEALLERIAAETGLRGATLSDAARQRILAHPLDGNVRELENLLHRALALGEGDGHPTGTIPATEPEPAPVHTAGAPAGIEPAPQASEPPLPADLQAWLDEQEREVLCRALAATGFNRTAAAALLGLNLRQMRYRMARLSISAPGAGPEPDDAG